MLKDGLYEQVINADIQQELDELDKYIQKGDIDKAEAPKILTQYLTEVIENSLTALNEKKKGLDSQISLVNRVISALNQNSEEDSLSKFKVENNAQQLLALFDKKNNILTLDNRAEIPRPETSIAQSSLFTGAQNEPEMFSELKKEILSSNRIDFLVSFIKWSGLRLIINELEQFTKNGGKFRIITTSYMGATDLKAVKELSKLPNTEIKISYDTKQTRLHAKTYVFYRDTDFTTAYVGSSNLSNAAMTSGLEWNVKVTKKDLPETIDKISATFESYWNSYDFELYSSDQEDRLRKSLNSESWSKKDNPIYSLDIRPYYYQQEILDKLEAERKVRGYFNNLVVAATGTGKTVISALDFKRFREENPNRPCRFLFIAHREEILKQSLYTFRAILKDPNFGELFLGNYKPDSLDNLFISIQTFNSQDFISKTTPDFYDYIIIDEFHHAAAPTYQKLLEYYKPKILLGLTATPERMDGKDILKYFNNRIAAEIRLPEAIDRKLLSPFQYFGVSDTVDLDKIKWTRGGYDHKELNNLLTFSGLEADRRANHVVDSVIKYITDINEVIGLGFCVSVEHAEFMSDFFNQRGIPSIYLTGSSSEEERKTAKERLVSGEIKFIFVVDIYNEGVDIPEVNTILFLRPTESLTIFLQQLGRGLRLADNKDCLTVLDFIGQANKRYSYEDKFKALLLKTRNNITREIKNGFISLPRGCYIQLEKKATKNILDNIRASYSNSNALINRIIAFKEDSDQELTLSNFLNYSNIDLKYLYKFNNFSRLCVRANLLDDFNEPIEEVLTKAFIRLSSIDSKDWINFLLEILPNILNVDINSLNDNEKRMLQMFYITIWQKTTTDWNSQEVKKNFSDLINSPILFNELLEFLKFKLEQIDFIDKPVNIGFDSPLNLYCSYTRDQIFTALDFMKPSTIREGVKWLPEKNIDVLLITLNKSDKEYSPTTLYQDYSINEKLFHWQSQSTTSENSKTGQRYIHHKENGSKILLFVRDYKTDNITGKASPYTFLGTANYVNHNGEKPMNIIWSLDNPIPARFLKKTNKLLTG